MSNENSTAGRVTVLGINGHIGHQAAKAFLAAGWQVTGFGRSNRHPLAGLRFVQGDAANVADMAAAIAGAEVVVNALHLPYDKWDNGAYDALTARIIAAMTAAPGATMVFPGTIYNYAASDRHVTPDLPQHPERRRGEIRVETEQQLSAAAARGDFKLIILRAGDFFGPGTTGDWFDQIMMREAGKGRFTVPGRAATGHSWAYLPDLAAAFERVARHRGEFGAVERFHFSGYWVTPEQMAAAIQAASPQPLTRTAYPWLMLRLMGLVMPVIREIYKMRYLWENPMRLEDSRLDALLGPGFGTPFGEAVAATVRPFLATGRNAQPLATVVA